MARWILVVFCSVIITGCSSGKWMSYSGVRATDHDIIQCKHYAAEEGKKTINEETESAGVAAASVIASFFVIDKLRDRCMRENGYRWVEGDE